jgi:hypothetical protein
MWLLVDSALILGQGSFVSASDRSEYFGYVIYFCTLFCMSAGMYRYSRSIAAVFLWGVADTPAPPTTPDEWFVVGCSLMGLWLSVKAIPSVLINSYIVFFTQPITAKALAAETTSELHLRYYLIQLVFGVALVLSRKGIWRVIMNARGR